LFSVGNPTIKKKWLEFISQHKKNYAFAIFNQFIVSLNAPVLTHSVSTTFIEYKCQPPGRGGATTTAVQLNSIFSAKTDPRENPEKTLINTVPYYTILQQAILYITILVSPLLCILPKIFKTCFYQSKLTGLVIKMVSNKFKKVLSRLGLFMNFKNFLLSRVCSPSGSSSIYTIQPCGWLIITMKDNKTI
jgi:hypothetical protein